MVARVSNRIFVSRTVFADSSMPRLDREFEERKSEYEAKSSEEKISRSSKRVPSDLRRDWIASEEVRAVKSVTCGVVRARMSARLARAACSDSDALAGGMVERA
jgi:hypothetical protein